jgi:superfamily II DNA/RNA helicase
LSQTFADLGVSQPVVRALSERGVTTPFAIQSLVIADVLDGRDVLAKSPTGSGKTIAFGAPLVDGLDSNGPKQSALILAPTRELVSQIVEELRPLAHARALRIASVYGGVGFDKQTRDARAAHIIVATPGRLEDLLNRRAFSLSKIEVLILDEADRMLDMGFRPAVDRIVAQCPEDRQTLFFSATLDGEAGRVAREYTYEPVLHEHRPAPERAADIEHRFRHVSRETRIDALVEELRADRELALVFVRTKHGADRLVKKLGHAGVSAVAMHGNKTQNQRERALAAFGAGRVDTLVATDVAARGIDVTGISHVINFDAPEDRDSYVHRVGRTGRAGRTGVGITFVEAEQAKDVGKIAASLRLHAEFERSGLARPHVDRARPSGGRPRQREDTRGRSSRRRGRPAKR